MIVTVYYLQLYSNGSCELLIQTRLVTSYFGLLPALIVVRDQPFG